MPLTEYFFFLNDTATTEISPLSLPAPLPISRAVGDRAERLRRAGALEGERPDACERAVGVARIGEAHVVGARLQARSEEHTSELQSRQYLVCRLLLEKKKNNAQYIYYLAQSQ